MSTSNRRAYALVFNYFNNWPGKPGVTKENLHKLTDEINNSPEGRFSDCKYVQDVFRELGVEELFYFDIKDYL